MVISTKNQRVDIKCLVFCLAGSGSSMDLFEEDNEEDEDDFLGMPEKDIPPKYDDASLIKKSIFCSKPHYFRILRSKISHLSSADYWLPRV